MRLTKLWTIPVTALLLTACSSETLTDSTTTPTDYGAVSFARLNVNLPSVPTTRASYTADPGDEAEYKVKGKTRIFLFQGTTSGEQGTSEDSYTYLYEAEPTTWIQQFNAKASDTEYQGSESFIIKLVGANKVYHDLYALVVLNGNDIPAPYSGQTFGNYNDAISLATEGNTARYLGDTNKGFVMANAANAAKAGTDADPTVLVPLTTYNSPTAAKAPAAGNTVFVERSAVKVTVRSPKSEYPLLSDKDVTIKPLWWTLTNTNKFMYPFHRVDGLKNDYSAIWTLQRFLGNISYEGFQRTMWAKDPNYSTVQTAEDCKAAFHVATADDVTAPFSKTATDDTYHPLYCAENTFDIQHMKKVQTTAVVVKAQITGYSRAVSTRADATRADATDADRYYVEGKVYKTDGMLSKVAAVASDAFGVTVESKNIVLKSLLGKADITLTTENFKDLKTAAGDDFTPTTDQLKQLNTLIGPITRYKGGICYYIAYIRHFDNKETPWKSGDPTYVGSDNSVDYNAKYLGRYGVVRNNWYDLSIQDFAYPGSPDIPTPTPDAPDDDHSVILLNVKVNPWAKEDTKFVPLE